MKTTQRRIYKLPTSFLKKSKWDVNLKLEEALKDYPDYVVSVADSQLLRWIDKLNGIGDTTAEITELKAKIGRLKNQPVTSNSKRDIAKLYEKLNNLQFKSDLVAVVIGTKKDYERANQGFTINGKKFRRLYGTPNGIKQRTILYINQNLYEEIFKRLNCGRDAAKEMIPAKLEAYQALTASGSTPIPSPNGIIVVRDCITHFKEDVTIIKDNPDSDEPIIEDINDYEIEHNASDGFGLMLPSYAQKVNKALTENEDTLGGFCVRYAFTKGMVYTFDYIEFAEKVAGTYDIIDVWGTKRDVRNAEIILTESQVKLWSSYHDMEEFLKAANDNNYSWNACKTTVDKVENVRTMNYQFLNPYNLSEIDLNELYQPTIDTYKDILGGNYIKSILYLGGCTLNDKSVFKTDYFLQALMIDPSMIDDSYISNKLKRTTAKKIDAAKMGKLIVEGSYLVLSGDCYALAESMFNLHVKGLLQKGEVYQAAWNDKADEVVLFRAPMTNAESIIKAKLNKSEQAKYWFKHLGSVIILNAWDSAQEALNGADFDGDTALITNNPVLVKSTEKHKTLLCLQQSAEKKVPIEQDMIISNIAAFNDDIGAITNRATSMYDIRSRYQPDSEEYKTLTYRLKACQKLQQDTIDKVKGIQAKPMPKSWYTFNEDMTEKEKKLVAAKKPYFMIYRYVELGKEYKRFIKNCTTKSYMLYRIGLDDFLKIENPTEEQQGLKNSYYKYLPISEGACLINRIAKIIENEFETIKETATNEFNYTRLKSGCSYSPQMSRRIAEIYNEYDKAQKDFFKTAEEEALDKDTILIQTEDFKDTFFEACLKVCPNEQILCDIILDLTYSGKSGRKKAFAWDICGAQIINNLLANNNYTLKYPCLSENGNIKFFGRLFEMKEIKVVTNEEK